MWDIKLLFFNFFFYIYNSFFFFLNYWNNLFNNGFVFFNTKIFFQFTQNLALLFGLKFLLVIFFLILIRGGTPRYRYDYLTKLGWLKMLGFIITIFLFSIFYLFIY